MGDHICIQSENIGALKEAADHLNESIKRLDKRINGTFDNIGTHIKEGEIYRKKVITNETTIKLVLWVFAIFNIAILVLLIKALFLK